VSLTNDMLKNLEKRRSLNSDKESLFHDLEVVKTQRSYLAIMTYIFFIFILLGFFTAIFYIALHYFQSRVVSTAPMIMKAPVVSWHKLKPMIPPPAQSDQYTPSLKQPVKQAVEVKTTPQDQIVEMYQAALAFIAQNQLSAAIEKLRSVILLAPDYQDARVTLATVYLENNAVADALPILSDGLTIQPNNIALTLLFARALAMQGHYHAALHALNGISDVAGNNGTYIDLLASVQESLGYYSEAIPLYRSLLTQDPSNTRWLIGLGMALEHTGQTDEALDIYKKSNGMGLLPPGLQAYVTSRIHDLGG